MNDHLRGQEALNEDDRRRAFREELRLTPETGGGRIVGRVPQRFLLGAIAVLVVLGLGGELVEHYFGNVGLPTSAAPTTTFTTPSTTPLSATTTVPSVVSAADAFIGLKLIGTANVPTYSLVDQHGDTVTPTTTQGRVTLITFYNKNCNDICPVLGTELHDVVIDLGAKAKDVVIDIINTDPFSFGASNDPLALTQPGLSRDSNVHFLTGPVANLNAVWKAYGIQVNVGASANEVAHNSLVYFVSPSSQLTAFATPFAKENKLGQFSLNSTDIKKFARGLELEAVSLNQ
jgi:cytochrome oxidase Cu insertion factor (SCO1/SenC/PrrC family)